VLRDHGYSPWIANEELLPGDDIGQTISEGIAAADVFVVIVSSASLKSRWVLLEIESAVLREAEKRVVVVPIVIGDVEPPLYLQSRLYLRLQPGFSEEALDPLLRSLQRISAEHRSSRIG